MIATLYSGAPPIGDSPLALRAIWASANKHTPFTRTFALQPQQQNNCSPAPELAVLCSLMLPQVFPSGGAFCLLADAGIQCARSGAFAGMRIAMAPRRNVSALPHTSGQRLWRHGRHGHGRHGRHGSGARPVERAV